MAIYCCYKCDKRHPTCHSTCPDYIEQSEAHKAIIDKLNKERGVQNGIRDQQLRGIMRALKHHGRSRIKKSFREE